MTALAAKGKGKGKGKGQGKSKKEDAAPLALGDRPASEADQGVSAPAGGDSQQIKKAKKLERRAAIEEGPADEVPQKRKKKTPAEEDTPAETVQVEKAPKKKLKRPLKMMRTPTRRQRRMGRL